MGWNPHDDLDDDKINWVLIDFILAFCSLFIGIVLLLD